MKKFKILFRETLLDSPYCPIEKHIVELPRGGTTEWFVNTSSDAVIVIPITKTGEVILQKSYKHGGGEIVIEFCAGLVDKLEVLLHAARRELREETGYIGKHFTKIGEVFANPTGSSMKYHFFLASGCVYSGAQKLDESEQIEVLKVKNMEAARKLLTDPKTKTSSATMAGLAFTMKNGE